MEDSNAYILGTDKEELNRLELQHSIWSSESHAGWKTAGFKTGDSLLDLGCGPGSCSVELAKIVGPEGRVIGIDRSRMKLYDVEESAQTDIVSDMSPDKPINTWGDRETKDTFTDFKI